MSTPPSKEVTPPEVEYDSPEFESEVATHALSLRGWKLTAALAFVTGTGFTLFGYVC